MTTNIGEVGKVGEGGKIWAGLLVITVSTGNVTGGLEDLDGRDGRGGRGCILGAPSLDQ